MRRALILILPLVLVAGLGLARAAGDMTARPLIVDELPKGTVTVRVGRGSLANVAVGIEVKATLTTPDGKVSERSETTQADGRATFSNLPVGSQFRAQAVVDGQPLQTANFTIPSEGGARLMLVSNIGSTPEPEDERAPPTMPPGQANPHGAGQGHARSGAAPGMLLGQILPKPELPPGTLELRLLDAQGAPLGHQEVRLGRMVKPEQGVAWIDSVTDEQGRVRFQRLDTEEDQSYIALFDHEDMRLGSSVFHMPKDSGLAGELRIPGRTKDISVLKISAQSKVLIDLREDKLEVMENLVVENTTDQIFQSEQGGLAVPLPAEANSVEAMAGGTPVESGPGGLLLRQSIPPSLSGQMPTQIRFGFYLPVAGEHQVTIRQPTPLGLEGLVVMVPAASGLTLRAPGLTPLPPQDDDHGGQLLMFQLPSVPRNGVLTLSLSGMPTRPGLGKTVAGLLAAALFVGTALGLRRPKAASKATARRESMLAELVELERTRQKTPDSQLDDKRAELLAALVALDAEHDGTGK